MGDGVVESKEHLTGEPNNHPYILGDDSQRKALA